MTNIDYEHLENYDGFDDLKQAFVDFANKVPFYGAVIACADDPHLTDVMPRITRRTITYGIQSPGADLVANDVELGPMSCTAAITRRSHGNVEPLGTLSLSVPGRHNLLNALAAVGVGLELGLPFARVASGLAEFRGAERRFEVRGEPHGILVVDDYGHHPTEIAAVLAAARAFKRRIVLAFQPHRYTRTARLLDAFGPALAGTDHIVLTDIYAAGEDPIPGITLEDLAERIQRAAHVPVDLAVRLDEVVPALLRVVRRGDLVITLGAGSIASVPEKLIAAIEAGHFA